MFLIFLCIYLIWNQTLIYIHTVYTVKCKINIYIARYYTYTYIKYIPKTITKLTMHDVKLKKCEAHVYVYCTPLNDLRMKCGGRPCCIGCSEQEENKERENNCWTVFK